MLNRTLLLSVIAIAVFALLLVSASTSVVAGEKGSDKRNTAFDLGNVIILGQGQSGAQNTSTVRNWFRNTFNNIFQEDAGEQRRETRTSPAAVSPASPIQPPKPPTAEEIRQSQVPNQGLRTGTGTASSTAAANTAQPSRTGIGAGTGASRGGSEERGGEENETSTQARLTALREGIFSDRAALVTAAQETRRAANTATNLVPNPSVPSLFDVDNYNAFPELPAPAPPWSSDIFSEGNRTPGQTASQQTPQRTDPSRGDLTIPVQNVNPGLRNPPGQNLVADTAVPARQIAQRGTALNIEPQQHERQILVSTSPRLLVEVEPPESVVIGQEGTYRIRITNIGDAPAEEVVVNAEIPAWIDIGHKDASDGGLIDQRRNDGSGLTDLEWKINRMNPGITNILVLGLVPHERQEIKLPIRYDFYRPATLVTVNVREPKLDLELIGGDEVLWNETVIYKLLVRNIGNGDAENVRLDLLQTSAGESFHEFAEPFRPGETRELDIRVQAGREREHIDITVAAGAMHNVKAEVNRRIRVLRPRLEMTVQTLPLHFVDNPAEFTVRVRNVGTADAENVTIRAELPLGMQYKSSNDGGVFATRQQQNIVEWRGKTVARGEMQTFTILCEPKREGNGRISVEAADPSGDILIASNTTFLTEAIVDLDLAVHAPRGPIELGQEVKYEIQVKNVGTRAAENVEVLIMFGHQFTPTATHGNSKATVTDDGQVAFEIIPAILPNQEITLNVVVKADGVGAVPIRAEVVRSDTGGVPVSLQKGLSAHIFSRTATAVEQPQNNEVFR